MDWADGGKDGMTIAPNYVVSEEGIDMREMGKRDYCANKRARA
jgi:hypothetical protein